MNSTERPPRIVRWTRRLEDASALDRPVHALEPSIKALFGTGTRGSVLRGEWLGHAVHPMLTDVAIGAWTSASVLDLLGGRDSSAAAQRLIATGRARRRANSLDRMGPNGRQPGSTTNGWASSTQSPTPSR